MNDNGIVNTRSRRDGREERDFRPSLHLYHCQFLMETNSIRYSVGEINVWFVPSYSTLHCRRMKASATDGLRWNLVCFDQNERDNSVLGVYLSLYVARCALFGTDDQRGELRKSLTFYSNSNPLNTPERKENYNTAFLQSNSHDWSPCIEHSSNLKTQVLP